MAITSGDLISHLGTNPLELDGTPTYIRVGRTELPVVAIEVRTGPDGKAVQVTLIGGFDLPLAKLEEQ